MTNYDCMRMSDTVVYYVLVLVLAAMSIVLVVPGILYLTTDQKASVDLAVRTGDESFQSWLASNNYELVSVEVTFRDRGIIKVKAKEPDKE